MPVTTDSGGVSGSTAPCLAAPTLPVPSLPLPFTLPTLAAATPNIAGRLCCNYQLPSASASLPLPPIPLGILGPGAVAFVQGVMLGIATFNAFLDKLVLKCPIE